MTLLHKMPLAMLLLGASLFAQEPVKLKPGSKIFISPMNGFELYLQAAFSSRKVPVSVVLDKDKADLIINGTVNVVDSGTKGRTTDVFGGASHVLRNYSASVSIVDPKSSVVVFSAASEKGSGKNDLTKDIAEDLAEKIKKQ